MSVYHQTMFVYGWEIGTDTYKEFDPDDGWENELEQEYGWRDRSDGDVAVIYDGRGGRYCYFGVVVASTNSTRNGPQSFDSPLEVDPCSGVVGVEAANNLKEAVSDLDLGLEEPPKYHIFTHVT